MKRLTTLTWLSGALAVLLVGTANVAAQQGRGNFDPQQMRQRIMERTKEALEITSDAEWKAIEPLILKVMEARRDATGGMGRGMFGRGGGRGGDNAPAAPGGEGGRRGGFFGEPSPEAEALQKAIENKASGAELKAAMAKVREARKKAQANLAAAQEELRKVLSVRQEAIAMARGLVD
jgi:hypothetical protein